MEDEDYFLGGGLCYLDFIVISAVIWLIFVARVFRWSVWWWAIAQLSRDGNRDESDQKN